MKKLKAKRDLKKFIDWQRDDWDNEFSQQMIDDAYKLIDLFPDNMIQPDFINKSYSIEPNVINIILHGTMYNVGHLELLGGKIHVEKLDEDHHCWEGSDQTHEFKDEIPKCILDFIEACCMRDKRYAKELVESLPMKRKHRKEYAIFEKSIENLPPLEKLGRIMARPISQSLDYSGISKKFMKIEHLKNKDLK